MESVRLSELKEYRKRLAPLLGESIKDLILFGSFVKGGDAQDVDVAIVVSDRDAAHPLKKELQEIFRKTVVEEVVDVTSIHSPLWLTLIKEGFSVKRDAFLWELYGIQPRVLYKYDLRRLTNVQKVQFGRGLKSILDEQSEVLTRSVVMIPLSKKAEMRDFLEQWGVYYESREYELIPLLRKEKY